MKLVGIKIIFSFYLFLWIVLPLIIFFCQLLVIHHNQSKVYSSQDDIVVVALHKKVFHKYLISNKNEILLNDKLYDIVQIQNISGSYVKLKLYEDNDEIKILRLVRNLFKILKHLFSEISSFQFKIPFIENVISFFNTMMVYLDFKTIDYINPVLDNVSPPPKV